MSGKITSKLGKNPLSVIEVLRKITTQFKRNDPALSFHYGFCICGEMGSFILVFLQLILLHNS